MMNPGQREAARREHHIGCEVLMGLVDSLRTAIAAIRLPLSGPSGFHGRTFRERMPAVREVTRKMAMRRLGNADLADDIAQEVSVKVLLELQKGNPLLDGSESVVRVLRRMVATEIVDQFRAESRREERDQAWVQLHEGGFDSWNETDARAREAELDAIHARAESKLTELQLRVLDLRDEQDLSRRAIGEKLKITPTLVRQYEATARAMIAAEYEAAGFDIPREGRGIRATDEQPTWPQVRREAVS
jgi:RNA polymerase sigma factor (sigma-70 family)